MPQKSPSLSLKSRQHSEFEIMSRLQQEFDFKFQSQRPLSMTKIVGILEEMENQMNTIDSDRDRPVFNQRVRDEWEEAIIKRYVYKELGDVGTILTTEEIKAAQGGSRSLEKHVTVREMMEAQFQANHKLHKEFEDHTSFEDCI